MNKIDDLIIGVHTVALSGHVRPDGDCVGSLLALYNYLQINYPEISTDIYLESPSSRFSFLNGFDKIDSNMDPGDPGVYDLMICLDCSSEERLGRAYDIFSKADHTVCIDHHISNKGYADENYIQADASSASEVLYRMLDKNKISKDIAVCLYVGIVSDTGIFKYSATSPETMRIAADLMEYGIDTNSVIDESFSSKSFNETKILGYALEKSILKFGGRVIYSVVTRDDMEKYNVSAKELDGIVAQLRLVRDVVCAFFIYETGHNEYKVSFRSDAPFDCNTIAGVFGGGGHVRAAGCNVTGELDTCIEAILLQIAEMEDDLRLERCD